jgi:hypothetical protein
MLFHNGAPLYLWVNTIVVYLINRLPLSTLNLESQYLAPYVTHLDYSSL